MSYRRHLAARATEQLQNRFLQNLALQVPQRDVDRRDWRGWRSRPARAGSAASRVFPHPFVGQSIVADKIARNDVVTTVRIILFG